ncbi:unnamed protein product [Vitrella brassicaformis CCMP3155]|uniref:Uncharacterized protein n=1 Tax=Vitrella brassicaformis (strain CCMP3155) TaxID=1169540 RepID=A0A0G4FDN3_VITBC|nr:unnamed protein product [Vitrella brassicaformis CCMP3155]|mmetsp:Transcript_35203/g.87418  ORF Transcript_35203/g.87418 Transcript_35203/m.87418 type:complete len:87 (+) Transcript_35203:23-283(+)|eukprot:CEM11305.1 unnamed protein product [Vitrella brassicaformis CCMP3155]
MRIRVLLFAGAKEAMRAGAVDVEVNASSADNTVSVAELMDSLRQTHPPLAKVLPNSLLAVNQEYAEDDVRIKEGDEVALIPPISGG